MLSGACSCNNEVTTDTEKETNERKKRKKKKKLTVLMVDYSNKQQANSTPVIYIEGKINYASVCPPRALHLWPECVQWKANDNAMLTRPRNQWRITSSREATERSAKARNRWPIPSRLWVTSLGLSARRTKRYHRLWDQYVYEQHIGYPLIPVSSTAD